MTAANQRPRVGIPWRTAREEAEGRREAYALYLEAVRAGGGEPVELSLRIPAAELAAQAAALDAFLLPGAPADVDPQWYHTARSPRCHPSDPLRERADFAILDAAFAARKPVLAICYGMQSLNVWLGGRLFQDIAEEFDARRGGLVHAWPDRSRPEPYHPVRLAEGSRLARLGGLAGAAGISPAGVAATASRPVEVVQVNSSHHQAVSLLGRELRLAADAPDGVIEAVELAADGHWVTGVQWHPERMPEDALSRALFAAFVAAAHRVPH
jgi:putative glutamine amidotransferase